MEAGQKSLGESPFCRSNADFYNLFFKDTSVMYENMEIGGDGTLCIGQVGPK